jgi:hypothetical protein
METPDSTPSPEVEVVPYVTGQVVPRASGSDLAEQDAPEADEDASREPSGPVWRFLLEPRWLGWHLFVVVAFWGMLWLGDWQFHRALGGNALSWAYTFEWPMFAVFGVVFWARTIRDEFYLRRGAVTEAELVAAAAVAGSMLPEGVGTRQIALPDDDADDVELRGYNAYLAKLNSEVKGHNKWLSARLSP